MAPSIKTSATAPRILVIETSARVGQLAIARGDEVLGVRRLDEARRHARDLAPQVAALLEEQHWAVRDLDAVFVSWGPGSYTGLRVGIMSAKTLAFATGCTLLGLETFRAIALQVPADVRRVDVIADAQQGRVYVQRFRCSLGALPSAETDLGITSLEEWQANRPEDVLVAGPGLHVYSGRIRERVVDQSYWDPQPAGLLQLGLARLAVGERDDVWTLEPLYLRPSGAEEKWAATRSSPGK
jgi:tRNA threonylcarbamoyladenosine biosynthesis protein TsaB